MTGKNIGSPAGNLRKKVPVPDPATEQEEPITRKARKRPRRKMKKQVEADDNKGTHDILARIIESFKSSTDAEKAKTVTQNVAFALEVIGRPKHVIRDQVPAILELVGLQEKTHRFPHELSGGEQQRVSIARAFVNRPLILLADEPTGNLDPSTSVGIMRLLERINETGTTVVMATHDRGIVDTMRRRVIELNDGEIVRDQARGVYE